MGDCIFFIASGTVAFTTTNGMELFHLEDGDHFGEIALILKNNKAGFKLFKLQRMITIPNLLAAYRDRHCYRIL